ncbi:hypothetical protein J2N86_02675 [Legionella lytica]|uniref:Uncharacterized protein n=1 Tax=Legionella lytica TaxID=96232 RepID=A0ABY4YA13_9GAMM|nr:hypothetical protein [Legionella lytica]USQ14256.1 hypothetical protein J2N86_02675 [Legionella lytica]
MTYLVTFCTFDHTVEGNPAWHGAFFLSKYNETKKQVEVVETWGFYGVPATGSPDDWFTKFKRKIGLDVDLWGNHGWLMHEEVRFMDMGHGLHGDSYELTEEDFKKLQEKCQTQVQEQQAPVRYVLGDEGLTAPSTRKVRCYPGEKHSKEIYEIELRKAKIEQRAPRLHPFDLKLSLGWKGPTLEGSHTCKTEALSILETVLPSQWLASYHKSTFPRLVSGGMENIILHSEGELDIHTRSSGEKVYYRDGEKAGVKLIWTIPPQKIKPLPGSTIDKLWAVDEEYCSKAKQVAGTLQKLEWMIRQADVPEECEAYRTQLLTRIVAFYQEFSFINPDIKTPKISGISGFFYSLANLPRNKEQYHLLKQIGQAENLFNSLYMALVHGMKINEKLPYEPAFFTASENETDEMFSGENPLEVLVSYLSLNDQKKLCKIIGRNYCDPDSEDENLLDDDEELSEARASLALH